MTPPLTLTARLPETRRAWRPRLHLILPRVCRPARVCRLAGLPSASAVGSSGATRDPRHTTGAGRLVGCGAGRRAPACRTHPPSELGPALLSGPADAARPGDVAHTFPRWALAVARAVAAGVRGEMPGCAGGVSLGAAAQPLPARLCHGPGGSSGPLVLGPSASPSAEVSDSSYQPPSQVPGSCRRFFRWHVCCMPVLPCYYIFYHSIYPLVLQITF